MNPNGVRGILIMAIAALVLAFGLGWAGSAGAAASGAEQESELVLAGAWVLNEELSDEAPERDGERRGRGRRGFGGRGGAGPDPEQIARVQEAVRELVRAVRRITIAGDAGEVVLTYGNGTEVRLLPDGREHESVAGSGTQVTRTAQWNGENLETAVELPLPTPVPRSLTVHQTYEVQDGGDGGRQLVVTSRIEGPARRLRAGDREIRRVYDEAEP